MQVMELNIRYIMHYFIVRDALHEIKQLTQDNTPTSWLRKGMTTTLHNTLQDKGFCGHKNHFKT